MGVKVREELLEYILELAKNAHPNEFAGFLRERDGVFEEILIAPGLMPGPTSVYFNSLMLPLDESIKGTVHSHPSPFCEPSTADLHFFSKFGGVHLIVCFPYSRENVVAYGSDGRRLDLEIVP